MEDAGRKKGDGGKVGVIKEGKNKQIIQEEEGDMK